MDRLEKGVFGKRWVLLIFALHAFTLFYMMLLPSFISFILIFCCMLLFYLFLNTHIQKSTQKRDTLLQEEKELLSATLHSVGEGVIITDADGKIRFFNSTAEQLCGWSQTEALDHSLQDVFRIVNSHDGKPADSPVDKVIMTGRVQKISDHITLHSRKGEKFQIADFAAPIHSTEDNSISGVILVFRDLTEQYHTKAMLFQAQKMRAIGTLAGGIAHDFNNILSAILGYSELVRDDLHEESEMYENIEQVILASHRAKELIAQILTFSRTSVPAAKLLNLSELIQETMTLLRASIPTTIDIEYSV